jgi:hypothetical protein
VDVAHTAEEPEERQLTDLELARRIAFIFGNAMKQKQQQGEDAPAGLTGLVGH